MQPNDAGWMSVTAVLCCVCQSMSVMAMQREVQQLHCDLLIVIHALQSRPAVHTSENPINFVSKYLYCCKIASTICILSRFVILCVDLFDFCF